MTSNVESREQRENPSIQLTNITYELLLKRVSFIRFIYEMSIENWKVINGHAVLMTDRTNSQNSLRHSTRDMFCIFNLSLANSSQIYDDSLLASLNGLYSNHLPEWPQKMSKPKKMKKALLHCCCWRQRQCIFVWRPTLFERYFAPKHALMKINNKTSPLCWRMLTLAIIFYGFSYNLQTTSCIKKNHTGCEYAVLHGIKMPGTTKVEHGLVQYNGNSIIAMHFVSLSNSMHCAQLIYN